MITTTKGEAQYLVSNHPNLMDRLTAESAGEYITMMGEQALLKKANRILNTEGPNKISAQKLAEIGEWDPEQATEAPAPLQGQPLETEAGAANNTSLLSQIDLAKKHMSTILYHKTRMIEYKAGCEDISGYIKQNGRKSRHSSRLKVPGKVVFYSRNAKGERVAIRQDAKDSTLYLTEYKEGQILIRQDTKGETLYLTNQDKGDKKAYRFTYSLENTTAHVDALWRMFNDLASI